MNLSTIVILALLIVIAALFILYIRIEMRLENEDIKPHDTTDYSRAKLAYQQAQQNFLLADADPLYIDIAISDLGASENRVNFELRRLRLEKAGSHLKGGESIEHI